MTAAPERNYKFSAVCLILFLGTLALYWPARHFDFVQYDDDAYVFNNPLVRDGISGFKIMMAFAAGHASNWHPLTWISHMIDCQLFGLNPGPHHVINILLHGANATLLFVVLRLATGAFWRSAFVAAVFAVHPLRVESVAWISERKDVLSGLFFMLTLWSYVKYAKAGSTPQAGATSGSAAFLRSNFYRLSLICFALGLLAKPMLVTVPAVLLLLDFWPLNRFNPFSTSDKDAHFSKGMLLEKVPFLFMALCLSVVTFVAQKSSGAIESVPVSERIENTFTGYFGYLEKLFWPRDLTFLYFRLQNVTSVRLILTLLALAGITIAVTLISRKRPYLATGWLWYCVMIFPVSGIVSVGLQWIADRYSYLPSIGILIIIAWGVHDVSSTWLELKTSRVTLAVASAAVLLTCINISRQQLMFWENTETLMVHALKLNPDNYVAHSNLGIYLSKQGRSKEASFHFQKARELIPQRKNP